MPAAERLAKELRERGHDVWIDSWKIKIGDSVIERINDGLAGTSFLVLCCSDIGAGAGAWTEREWMSALARQLDGANVHILPVRLTGGTSPPILADVKYADLVADWQRGVDEICDALG